MVPATRSNGPTSRETVKTDTELDNESSHEPCPFEGRLKARICCPLFRRRFDAREGTHCCLRACRIAVAVSKSRRTAVAQQTSEPCEGTEAGLLGKDDMEHAPVEGLSTEETQAVLTTNGVGGAQNECPPMASWALGLTHKPTAALKSELTSLGVLGIVNPPRIGRTCGVDGCLILICISPDVMSISRHATRIARKLRRAGGKHSGLGVTDIDCFVPNMQALAGTLTPALNASESALCALQLHACEIDAAVDAEQLASLRRVLRAVAAAAVRPRVAAGLAQPADVDDAASDGSEWRVAVTNALLDELGMSALLLVEHHRLHARTLQPTT